MKTLLLLSLLLTLSPLQSPAATLPPELAKLEAQFLQLRNERVIAPFEVALAKLDSSYVASINRKMAEEKAAGHLDGVLALEAEQQRLTAKQPLPEADAPNIPTSLKELRTILRQQLTKITAQRTANLKSLMDPLDIRLAQLEADLTKADRLPDAKIVRDYRERLVEAAASTPTGERMPTSQDALTNTLGMTFVPVPGTDVLFCIHETRRQDYAVYADKVPGVDDSWKSQSKDGVPIGNKNDHPVVGVSWEDAVRFCEWMSKKEGKLYRLPTDEEWSYAVGIARHESRTMYVTPESLHQKTPNEFPWGGNFPLQTNDKAGNYGDTIWRARFPSMPSLEGYTDGFATTAPVMSFQPNKTGLFDLGGNVWEWVADWWNPQQRERVLRGGSFYSGEKVILLSSYRGYQPPMRRAHDFGFRCVVQARSHATASTMTPPPAPAPSTSRPDQFTNILGMKFLPVPGTDVLFCIHETRYRDYAAYAAQAKDVDSAWKSQTSYGITLLFTGNLHPVVRVSWDDARKFCAWLSQKEGRTYRLPTDREWSIAAGLGQEEQWTTDTTPATVSKSKAAFPWGSTWPPPTGAGNYSDGRRKISAPSANTLYIEGYDDGFPTTAPVMSFQPNQLGLYDLGGNVWEWVADWYNLAKQHRTLRGGSFVIAHRDYLLTSYRSHNPPDFRHDNHGFRIVLEPMKP